MNRREFVGAAAIGAAAAGGARAAQPVALGRFSERSIEGWRRHHFKGRTDYRLTELDGEWVLSARSDAGASAFYRKVDIDLQQTPILHWRWRVERRLQGLEEMSRPGDDYAARVYVVYKRGFFDRGMALNYVWSGRYPVGESWPNAYADESVMLALQSAQTPLGQWRDERRDVREDFRRLLGVEVRRVQLVALMSDTDNSGQSARAHYGDLRFDTR